MKRLDRLVRAVQRRSAPEADVHALLARERAMSPELGGRSVLDDTLSRRRPARPASRAEASATQLSLFH